jgi:tetratricopeptide (TPR) repeat protein
MGTVYKARKRASGEPVALKILRGEKPEERERFEREAQVLAELHHPGIVRYLGHGLSPSGEPYLAMEWLDGEDLSDRLARGPLPISEALRLIERAATALAAAHARGVLHRDIKPANLFLPAGAIERVTLLDFGIARRAVGTRPMTRTGLLLGTPGYLAPEQARGEREIDARADVFALGCVLFECLTGRPAFTAEHVMAVLAKILFEPAPRPSAQRPDVPRALDDLVARMLAKDREPRPRDAAAVAAEAAAITARASEVAAAATMSAEIPLPPPSLGAGEQRLLSVILVDADPGRAGGGRAPTGDAPTLSPDEIEEPARRLRAAVDPFGARLEALADGSVVAVLSGAGGAVDQAARAARCALAMRAAMPGALMALATGRGMLSGTTPFGEVIDRAVRLLRAGEGDRSPDARAPILLDEATAGLLSAGFDVASGASSAELRAEREASPEARTLLGKPSPCVGRERELRALEDLLAECLEEPRSQAVVVTGPPGIGKSRLGYELLREVRRRAPDAEVWIARGDPMRAGSSFGMAAELLRRAADLHDGEPAPERRQKLLARARGSLGEADAARVAAHLGEVLGLGGADEERARIGEARLDPERQSEAIRRAWEDFCASVCAPRGGAAGARPLVLLLEDLHWGDAPSVKLIDAALLALRDRPLFVVALARPEVHELFPGLWAPRGVQEIRLGELSRRASERLAREVLGEAAPASIVRRVAEQAAGNAFYLEELIRAAAEGKGDALPETVLAMVHARLSALPDEMRRVMRVASIFGETLWSGGVRALLGDGAGAAGVAAIFRELVHLELLVPRREGRFPGEEELAFRHALVREGAYQTLTEADRALGHRLAGEWLERMGEADAMTLAEHFERGGERARAAELYARAMEDAMRAMDLGAILDRRRRAIACGAEGEVLGRVLQQSAEVALGRWDARAAFEESREAMRLLPRWTPRFCRAATLMSTTAGVVGERQERGAFLRELADLSEIPLGSAPYVLTMAAMLMAQLTGEGGPEEAQPIARVLSAAADLAREAAARDPGLSGALSFALGILATIDGDLVTVCARHEEAMASLELAGDKRMQEMAFSEAMYARLCLGEYEEVLARARELMATEEPTWLRRIGFPLRSLSAMALARLGALDEARSLAEDGAGEPGGEVARDVLAFVCLCLGDLDGAERECRALLARFGGESSLFFGVTVRSLLAKVMLERGRLSEALEEAEEAARLLDKMGNMISARGSLARLTLAEVLYARGDIDRAREAILKARRHLLSTADKIADPARRRVFLERVPENARTLSLAALWADG